MTNNKDNNFAADINDSLIANINHALRTPLNGVVGMMGLLSKTGLDKNQSKYAHIIRESTENLMLQLDNILELAKIEDGDIIVKSKACNLRDIIKASLQPVIAPAVKKEIPISLDYGHDLPETIEIDAHKLQLILTNLFACALKFVERGKIVLKVTKENVGDEDNPHYKLRFTLENSKILFDALYGTMEQYQDIKGSDLREFGEVTVSLLTTQQLLNALGANINFDHLKDGHEPPFHFDLNYTETTSDIPQTPFGVLEGKRVLVLQDDILEQNVLTQCLRLWNIDARPISDQDKILDEISEAYRAGREIDLLFITSEMEGKKLAVLKEKVQHIIMITGEPGLNKAWLSEFSAHLIPPIYPEELLSALSSLYEETSSVEERSLSEEASHLLSSADYEAVSARVMVVEDDTTSRLYATELLEGFGCRVATAEDGKHALIRLYKCSDYDVIFMDCMMPRMDGYTATQKLREAGYTDIPIVALTANTLEKDREKCLAAGMNDYITKPVREQDLHDMLKKHLKKAKK